MDYTPQHFCEYLTILFPTVDNFLEASSDFQFLVAIILSAQMTDVGVNKATKKVFASLYSPEDFLRYGQENLLQDFSSINFYPTKTKNIMKTAQILCEQYNGEIPKTRKELTQLPGVGNKTAGVFLVQKGYDFAFPVDTHIARVARVFGFTNASTPDAIEADLQKIFPKESWNLLHKQMILYGRKYLPAKMKGLSPHEAWTLLEQTIKAMI